MVGCFTLQNLLTKEGTGFKIAMGAFDKTRPPVGSFRVSLQIIMYLLICR